MAAADDVYESWEDMDEIGLDRKITSFLASTPRECSQITESMPSGPVKVVMDTSGTLDAQMMAQQPPAVKILKRPVISENNSNSENKQRPVVKTLQQRQQEYQQARLRILGEAKSPEDIAEEMTSKLQLKVNNSNPVERPQEKCSILTKGGIISAHCDNNNPSLGQTKLPYPSPNLVTVLRSPRGPDGTRGFLLRR